MIEFSVYQRKLICAPEPPAARACSALVIPSTRSKLISVGWCGHSDPASENRSADGVSAVRSIQ